ncbi:MAG: hypothetical protein HZC40_04520 [Chloroflexi bacterium]|nr:hypothetical protein [Chloroflexota bacterium]
MNFLSRWLWLAVWIGLAIYLAFALWLGFAGLAYPYQLDYGEGIVLWFAQELARGHAIYKPLTEFPYASSNYPPVALMLAAMLMPIFGDGYGAGRLLNFASALIVAALIFRIVRVETRMSLRMSLRAVFAKQSPTWSTPAILAAIFFLASPYIYHWVSLFRVDLIGLAFAFTAIYFAWKREQNPITNASRELRIANYELRIANYYLPITIFSLLALYTKHTLLSAPLAIFIALFRRDKGAAIKFALALGASGGAIYLALDVWTRGGFSAGLIESNATVFLFEQLVALLKNFVTTFPVLILLAGWAWFARIRARRIGVLEWYALSAFAALALSGRVGAWENYFFEAIAITCVYFGIQISNFKLRIANRELRITILLLIQLALFHHDPRIAADLIARDAPANRALAALLARTNGNIISVCVGSRLRARSIVWQVRCVRARAAAQCASREFWRCDCIGRVARATGNVKAGKSGDHNRVAGAARIESAVHRVRAPRTRGRRQGYTRRPRAIARHLSDDALGGKRICARCIHARRSAGFIARQIYYARRLVRQRHRGSARGASQRGRRVRSDRV